jgi:hypothetical protein
MESLLPLSACSGSLVAPSPVDLYSATGIATGAATGDAPSTTPGKAFLLSAVLPGAGQYTQGHRRWVAYAAVEVTSWVLFGRARSRATGFRDDFEDLAWETARTFAGDRRDGDWKYYERLTKFARSGAYDTDRAQAGIQPEEDVTTFNGDAWKLARQLNFSPGSEPVPGDAEYEAALEFYRDRAVTAEFEWDWTGLEMERAGFQGLIDESDAAFKDASLIGGAIVLNHVLSALDAFLSARVTGLTEVPVRFTSGWAPGINGRPGAFTVSTEWRVR